MIAYSAYFGRFKQRNAISQSKGKLPLPDENYLTTMKEPTLSPDDLLYIAEMLRAVRWVSNELQPSTVEAINELEESSKITEAALRRVAAEMTNNLNS